jgi:hypothetical protein
MPNKNRENRFCGWKIYGIAFAISALLGGFANATENGATEYPLGADSIDAALMPPPGHGALLSYNEYFDANIFSGAHSLSGSHVGVYVSAYRGIYTWPFSYDDGKITISSEIVLGGGNINVTVPTPTGGLSNGSAGLIDPSFWPVAVNYHSGSLFLSADAVIWAPLGTYNKNAAPTKGLGLNHYTFAPALYLTYLINPKFQLDMASVTDFNTTNPNTQYMSGADETFTVSLSYWATRNIQVGPTGYIYEQFTNDTQHGVVYNNGNRGQTLAIGAQAIYNIGHGGILVKYLHDTLVQNRAGGDQFWIQWALPF